MTASGMSIVTGHPALLWPLLILAGAGLGWLATRAAGWWSGQYELTWEPLRITRRWYGPRAHVRLRAELGLFCVLMWDDHNFPVPWLKVCPVADENTQPFWAPVTSFTPYRVRRLRPSMFRRWRRQPFPLVWEHQPLPAPAGGLRSDA
jgi:hypothetical protein